MISGPRLLTAYFKLSHVLEGPRGPDLAMIRPAQLAAVAVPRNRQSRIKIRDATSSFSTPRRRSATSHTPDGNAALPERMNAESFRHRARRANRATVRFDRTPAVERGAARGSCVWNPVASRSSQGGPGSLGRCPRQGLSGPQPATCANNVRRPHDGNPLFTTSFTTRSRLASARGRPSRPLS